MDYIGLINQMKTAGVRFADGLTQHEFDAIEQRFGFHFPPDLKQFLSLALPISDKFINWRDSSERNTKLIRERMNWCLEGMLTDVENNRFWMYEWGPKPADLAEAKSICEVEYHTAPRLIPIYAHRYIPETPSEEGNPILSVYQTDIIYYGGNLYEYLLVEFGFKKYEEVEFDNIKRVRFWSDIIDSWEADYMI